MKNYKINKKAFTLSEVLISLVIIGVIAAITIPLMVVNYQKYVYYTKFMKAYNTLNQAVQKSIIDNGPLNSWNINASWAGTINSTFNKYIVPYLDVRYFCSHTEAKMLPCLANEYKTLQGVVLNNSDDINHYNQYYDKYILADGSAIKVRAAHEDNYLHYGVISVWVDTNSQKGPNVYGRDTFLFELFVPKNLFLPKGSLSVDSNGNVVETTLSSKYTGNGITAGPYLIRDGKMNY